ncbi:hypothetical protein GPECTOR_30g184 [Gonium pectorale]|uniref:SET domain-containing protein n=1 Tax=Gonium pectorale TaxID=33097 RepID=A0A150GE25_GONPE|nr:hypothetical protein GPECTOR_30g184 [Gonium pectorale]|eukprot:KXZ48089.1 hypothetical protein GPECTOR_30g184 [Gonium pectorale]
MALRTPATSWGEAAHYTPFLHVTKSSQITAGAPAVSDRSPGQVRVCGLTFDAALAPAVASVQAAWQERLGRELRYADPTKVQLAFTGSPIDQHLSRAVVCNKLARLLGLDGDNGRADAPLPEGPVLLEGALEPCGDPARGGAGLQATVPLKKNAVLGVDWLPGNDVDSQEAVERANCAVVPVSVRGLVLPVLVALRDIAPREQLLRDYGAGWWRDLAVAWEVAEDDGLDVARLLHGTLL